MGLNLSDYIKATGELLVTSVIDNITDAVEYFEPKDDSPFGNPEQILSRDNSGFCIDGVNSLTRKMSYEGCYIQGPTGSGKTSTILIPSILTMTDSSLVIHDPSQELFDKTSGHLDQEGYRVYKINFATPGESHFFNPLEFLKTESEISKLSNILVRTVLGSHTSDPFWNLQSIALLNCIIGIVLTFDLHYRNFASVRHVLKAFAGSRKQVDTLFAKNASDKLFADYKSIVALESKVLSSVIATASAALSLWADEDVCYLTSKNSFPFSDLRKEKTVVYLVNSTSDAKYYSPLISIYFQLLFKEIMSKIPSKKELDIFLLIDEASTLYMNLPSAICNVRKYRAGILTAWQSYESMVHAYGRENAEVIYSNSITRLYFTGQSLKTTEELERVLGKKGASNDRDNRPQLVMSSIEIRTMKQNEAIVLHGALKPLKISLTPYYLQPFANLRTKLSPTSIVGEESTQIPLIPL